MNHKLAKVLCTMAIGAVVSGIATAIFYRPAPKAMNMFCQFKKKMAKTLRSMGGIADAIGYMLK